MGGGVGEADHVLWAWRIVFIEHKSVTVRDVIMLFSRHAGVYVLGVSDWACGCKCLAARAHGGDDTVEQSAVREAIDRQLMKDRG